MQQQQQHGTEACKQRRRVERSYRGRAQQRRQSDGVGAARGRAQLNRSASLLLSVCCVLSQSLAGTLKAAKRRGIVSYKPELLLQGMSDNEQITLKKQA